MENIIVLTNRFDKKSEKTFEKVFFDIPSDVHSISIEYKYDKTKGVSKAGNKEKSAIDIALFDNEGTYLGSSGANKDTFFVSESYATPGYKRTAIRPGKWAIMYGLYQIMGDSIEIIAKITINKKEPKFYIGDCHTHTYHSDGGMSPEKLLKKAKKNKFDFFFITDHNTNTAYKYFPQDKQVNIFPGFELTCYAGHFNLLGVKEPIKEGFQFESREQLDPILTFAREKGAILSINHPLCKKCGWLLPYDGLDYDTVEVWNGPMRIDNVNAVKWWHNNLINGNRKVAIGGSDYHRDYVVTNLLGNPTTAVYAKSNNQEDITDGILKGHCYVTHSSTSSKLIITSGDKMMGDSVKFEKDSKINLYCTKLKRGYKLIVYNNNDVIYERIGKGEKEINIQLCVPKSGFVRAEIVYNIKPPFSILYRLVMLALMPLDAKADYPPMVYALTNPIYFEE